MINLSILGSTGSIGTQTLDVLEEHSASLLTIGLSAGSNVKLLQKQTREFLPEVISVKDEQNALALKKQFKNKVEVLWGEEGNVSIATHGKSDRIVVATPGLPGIKPTQAALKKDKIVALATKEVLVSAGEVMTNLAKKHKTQILPIDSEHSAIFQCLEGRKVQEISRIFLTCSGGPFRGKKLSDLKKVTVEQALNHPNWKMGKKITVDSATLMNKGFEIIEAYWLFDVPLDKIKVVIHPQSVIHSAVEFVDGTIIAQIGPSDMRLPIQHALFYPEVRKPNKFKRFRFNDYPNLTFEHPDKATFRCLQLAIEAAKDGGSCPAVLNAANDIATSAFLEGRLEFYKIPYLISRVLEKHVKTSASTLDYVLEADTWARRQASLLL